MKKWQKNRRSLGPWLKLEGRFLIIIFQRKPFNHIDLKVTLELNVDISVFLFFSLSIIAYLPERVAGGWQNRQNLLTASHNGRIGLNCSQVFILILILIPEHADTDTGIKN
jgi:hypothetical protein